MKSTDAFLRAYRGLTSAQKEAVDTVEGPVLVVAGPGTGKTHVLTLRIANILQKTDARPEQILALTFTESAARTLARRLSGLIGEATARGVTVNTFHGFAQMLKDIREEDVEALAGKRLAGDVETALLWREVFDEEDFTYLRTGRSRYHAIKDLARLREDLVREAFDTDAYRAWLESEEKRAFAGDEYRFKRGSEKGNVTKEGEQLRARYEKAREAARAIDAYEAKKDSRGVYDFSDILRYVVRALETNDSFRAWLQETYQYVLADEHQDANALQHALLDCFAHDDHPNLFVVGDEKQTIYRFQGADASALRAFSTKYPRRPYAFGKVSVHAQGY